MPQTWIIPAYAGSTLKELKAKPADGDHPRICGEHMAQSMSQRTSEGSSPHMRGAQRLVQRLRRLDGIIPAYAGSTDLFASNNWYSGDHPRICGEHVNRGQQRGQLGGSSPHMRGAPLSIDDLEKFDGIIPAYAGSTQQRGF